MFENYLILQSGADIPFPQARLTIHQPTIKEISMIGENNFYMGCELLKFSKNSLSIEDRNNLINQTNFDIIMTMLRNQGNSSSPDSYNAMMVLLLLFPKYQIKLANEGILFIQDNEVMSITNQNYDAFREIFTAMFHLTDENKDYNPANGKAAEIAEKFRKAKQKRQKQSGTDSQQISILERYVSILSVGEQKDKNLLVNYTVSQLFDEFERYQLKTSSDIYIQAKMAGATGMQEVDNWMKDFHSDDDRPRERLKRINTI